MIFLFWVVGNVNTKYGLHHGFTCGSDCIPESLNGDLSLAECAGVCSKRADCKGIEYPANADPTSADANPEAKCKLLKEAPTGSSAKRTSSTTVYWKGKLEYFLNARASNTQLMQSQLVLVQTQRQNVNS